MSIRQEQLAEAAVNDARDHVSKLESELHQLERLNPQPVDEIREKRKEINDQKDHLNWLMERKSY